MMMMQVSQIDRQTAMTGKGRKREEGGGTYFHKGHCHRKNERRDLFVFTYY